MAKKDHIPGVVSHVRHYEVEGKQLVSEDNQESLKIGLHRMLAFIKNAVARNKKSHDKRSNGGEK